MKMLEEDKRIGEIKYHCIELTDAHRIWECQYASGPLFYEVHTRIFMPDISLFEKVSPAHEVFLSDKAFGHTAWTYSSKEKAELKALTLSKHSSWKYTEG